ncbi:MAG: hypothetical protein WC390_11895 [Sulfurimonas sp.]|jgi:hypothetical protein
MSIIYQIPQQSRYVSTSTIFTGTFNVPTPGLYDFGIPANQDIDVLELKPGVVYLIERMSIGANIAETEFLSAIQDFPQLTIKRSLSAQIVYQRPFPIVNFADGIECAAWIHSDKQNDFLTLSLKGTFAQTPAMIGLAELKIQISLSIYAIDSAYYNVSYRDVQNISIGQRNRT